VGQGTRIWHQAQVREHATIGANCILGKGAYVDAGVHIGSNVKIQNGASVFRGAHVEDDVFVGPGCMVLNDKHPRSTTPAGELKTDDDWAVGPVLIRRGASIGAGAIILPDVKIGAWAMVSAGAVVTYDVPAHGLVIGVPARLTGWVCKCGKRLAREAVSVYRCAACGWIYHADSELSMLVSDGGAQRVRHTGPPGAETLKSGGPR